MIVFLSFFSCDKIGNETTTGIEDQFLEKASSNTDLSLIKGKPGNALEYLGKFETLVAFGFTPDDATFSPLHGGSLFLSAAGPGERGVFEVTPTGKLIQSFDLPDDIPNFGYNIARVSSGPKVGHFFLIAYSGSPEVQVYEFDQAFKMLKQFPFVGYSDPGDAIAYNKRTQTLVIPDRGSSPTLFEVTTNGEELTSFRIPDVVGITFNEQTGTYFGVNGAIMHEFSTSGITINTYDLSLFGVFGAVGIAYGQGKLFIADEGGYDPENEMEPNDIGFIYIMQVSH